MSRPGREGREGWEGREGRDATRRSEERHAWRGRGGAEAGVRGVPNCINIKYDIMLYIYICMY